MSGSQERPELPLDEVPSTGIPLGEMWLTDVSSADEPRAGARSNELRRALLLMLGICVVIGLVQGAVWAFTAPGIPYQVLADGRSGALPTTSTYHFVDVALFALSGSAIGILLAVGAWHVRWTRGWQMLVALVGGSLLGAVIAWAFGSWLAPGTDPASVGSSAADSIVIAPPTIGTILVVLAQPALAAAVYTFLVAWNGHPDLGRPAMSETELVT